MRTELGIAGATGLLVVAGQGVLLAIGFTQLRVKTLLASSGLAYLVGVASTLLVGIALLTLGAELNIPTFTALALLLGGAGAALALRRRGAGGRSGAEPARTGASRSQKVIVGLAFALVLALLVLGLLDAGVRPLAEWDGWSIWTRKAAVLTSSGLDTRVFAGSPYEFAHLEYPVLLPLFESVYFRAMGGVDGQAIHAALWILYLACLGSVAYLGSRCARIWVWLPVVLGLVFGPQFFGQLLTAYADVPLGLLAAPGVLCLGLWLRELDWRYLALGGLLLAAAGSVKNEGMLLVVACFVAAAIVLAVGRAWRPLGRLALALVGVVVALLPWQLWIRAHDIKSSLPISKGLDPSFISDHSDRIRPTLKALIPMLDGSTLSYFVPLALTLVLVGIATRGLRRVAAFYLLAGLGTLASVVWAFVITPDALDWQIATSGSRVIMGVTFVSLAALVHMGGLLDGHRTGSPGAERDVEPVAAERTASDPVGPVPETARA